MGAGLNAVEVSDPETFLANGNKPAEFSRRCTAASACVVWGVKGEQQWRAEAQRNHCRYGEWKMVFCVHPDLALTFAAAIVGPDKRGIYYDATRPSDWKCCLITAS